MKKSNKDSKLGNQKNPLNRKSNKAPREQQVPSNFFSIGKIYGAKGLKGELRVRLDVFDASEYINLESIFLLQNEQIREAKIKNFNLRSFVELLLQIEGVSDRTQAEELKGAVLCLPESLLPQLNDYQFFYHEVIGFDLEDKHLGVVGTIKSVLDMPAQDVLEVQLRNSEKTALVPITDDFIVKINRDEKTLLSNLPDGLLEVYLD